MYYNLAFSHLSSGADQQEAQKQRENVTVMKNISIHINVKIHDKSVNSYKLDKIASYLE